jgi:hypothetical protein
MLMAGKTAVNDAKARSTLKGYVEKAKGAPNQGAASQQRIADQLLEYIDLQTQSFLNGWQIQADSALTVAQQPPNDDSKVFWFIALGGNLLWAGTCLVNPAAATSITIMSFAGAAIGSGSVEQVWKNPPEEPADAKALAAGWIAEKRDQLEKTFKKARRQWATDLAGLDGFGLTTEEMLDTFQKYIWTNMFPRIAFDDHKYSAIHTACVKNAETMLADFRTQWQKYVQMASWFGMGERKRRNIYFKYYPNVDFDMATGNLKSAPQGGSREMPFY